MNGGVSIVLRDESHLPAHLDDLRVPLETALDWIRFRLEESPRRSGEERLELWAAEARRHDGPRHAASLDPGGLLGEAARQGTFVLHTLYPGRAAPREIHDPEISIDELRRGLEFWSRHAIVVAIGEWEAQGLGGLTPELCQKLKQA